MEKNTSTPRSRFQVVLIRLLTGVMVLMLLAAFYLAVIMGDPNQDPAGAQAAEKAASPAPQQNVLAAQPARNAAAGENPVQLAASFPAPYLTLSAEGGSFAFQGGQAYDSAFEGGFARIMTLHYQSASGAQVSLTSIYPARAFALLGRDGYALSDGSYSLAGQPAVRMDGSRGLRIHTQGSEALYALTAPAVGQEELAQILKAVHLDESPLSQ